MSTEFTSKFGYGILIKKMPPKLVRALEEYGSLLELAETQERLELEYTASGKAIIVLADSVISTTDAETVEEDLLKLDIAGIELLKSFCKSYKIPFNNPGWKLWLYVC